MPQYSPTAFILGGRRVWEPYPYLEAKKAHQNTSQRLCELTTQLGTQESALESLRGCGKSPETQKSALKEFPDLSACLGIKKYLTIIYLNNSGVNFHNGA